MVSRIDTSIQLTLTDPVGDTSGSVALKIFQDINEGKYLFFKFQENSVWINM